MGIGFAFLLSCASAKTASILLLSQLGLVDAARAAGAAGQTLLGARGSTRSPFEGELRRCVCIPGTALPIAGAATAAADTPVRHAAQRRDGQQPTLS